MNNKLLITLAVLMGLIGIVWFGQGMGWISGSVMTNESRWAVIGGTMIVVAAGLLAYARARRSR